MHINVLYGPTNLISYRYRLMLRRCLEAPNPCFGMIPPPRSAPSTSANGNTSTGNDYGIMLQIRNVQMLPDGRSVVETWGTWRFRIMERGMRDGYTVARVERIEDYEDDSEEHGIDIHGDSRKPRRSSFPSTYLTPFNPTMGPLPDRHGHRSGPYPREANENTPLLAPPVPRIEEECDAEDITESLSTSKLYREEIGILTKYTIPVFGYVVHLPLSTALRDQLESYTGHISSNIRSWSRLSSP